MAVNIIKREQVKARVTVSNSDGKVLKDKEVVMGEVESTEPMANIGVKMGTTQNIGEYESVRVDVSLYMPTPTDDDSLEKTYKKVYKWVDKKLGKVVKTINKEFK